MDLTAELDAPCPPDVLFAHVDDLGGYPEWLEIVERAEAAELHPDDDGDAAWLVDLRGRLGPSRPFEAAADGPHRAAGARCRALRAA